MHRTRRQFLINGIQVSAALPLLGLGARALRAKHEDPILLLIQLTGGNDGLNMVVPHSQDAYYRARPRLAHKPGSLHALDQHFGLHPRMGALAGLHTEGTLAVLHGVGYPKPNRSHFRSMDIWHTADLVDENQDMGWLGRMADQIQNKDPERLVALHVGTGELPLALYGQRSFAPTARNQNNFQLEGSETLRQARDAMLMQVPGKRDNLGFLRAAAQSTYRAAERMQNTSQDNSKSTYPDYNLAQQLKLVSQLIASDFGPRIFHLELTGFDTHVNQARVQGERLNELSASLAAFQHDLESRGLHKRVLSLVFSEFGRRVAENQSGGTDHGAAGPCLLVGGGVRAGMHGKAPDLERLENGDIPYSTDFRSLYSTLESDWMKLACSTDFRSLDLLS